MLSITIPKIAMMCFSYSMPLVKFDVLDPLEYLGFDYAESFGMNKTTPAIAYKDANGVSHLSRISKQTRDLGYETDSMMPNLGSVWFVTFIYLARLLVLAIAWLIYRISG